MQRMALALTLLALGEGCSSCEGSPPCTECPSIAGAYTVAINAAQAVNNCTQIPEPEGVLILTQQGALLSGNYSEFSLTGTFYESGQVSLSGFGSDGGVSDGDSLFMTAQYAGGDAGEGGASFAGNMTANFSTPGSGDAGTCLQYLPFDAYPE
jgi:hypothetical protein